MSTVRNAIAHLLSVTQLCHVCCKRYLFVPPAARQGWFDTPATTAPLVDHIMFALFLVGLAASPYVGRKVGRTRDLRYEFLYSPACREFHSLRRQKNIPVRLRTK